MSNLLNNTETLQAIYNEIDDIGNLFAEQDALINQIIATLENKSSENEELKNKIQLYLQQINELNASLENKSSENEELNAPWAGDLTFSGTYATSTYYTAGGCSLAIDKQKGMAFLTIQGGTTSSYENIYYNADYITLPDGVTFLPTQTYGGSTSGTTSRYFTAAFTGITGKINVSVDLAYYNSSYDYVRPTITMTYA